MTTSNDFKSAVAKIQKLSSSPAVFAKAHKLIVHPDSQLIDIVNVVKLDSALTADIIRLSNSAALGVWESTGNLNSAMGRLGLKEVDRYLALSMSKSLLNRDLDCYDLKGYDYWSYSVSVAILMEVLAARNLKEQADAYTVGILHATGRLVINQALNDLSLPLRWNKQMPIVEWETTTVGSNYAEAGSMLLKVWGFPQSICEVIAQQLETTEVASPSMLLRMLRFCLRLVAQTGNGFSKTDWELPATDPFLQEFNISPLEIRELVQIAGQMHGEAERSIGMK